MSDALAEKSARTIWPLLLILPAMIATCAVSLRLSEGQNSRSNAITTLVLAVGAAIVSPIFRPGEIDHHNAQLVCVLVMVSALLWSNRCMKSAVIAGMTGGLLLAIGLEYAYIFAIIFAALALISLHDLRWRKGSAYAFTALGLSTLVLWLGTTPSALRFVSMCDALSINIAIPVAIVGIGMAILMVWLQSSTTQMRVYLRWGFAISIALIAGIVFYSFDRRCLLGPYGTLDPRLFPLWIDHVDEVQDIFTLLKTRTSDAMMALIFPLTVSIAMLIRGKQLIKNARKDISDSSVESLFPIVIMMILFATAFIGMVMQIRIQALALWLGVPLAAAVIGDCVSKHPRNEIRNLIGALLWNPLLVIGFVPVMSGLVSGLMAQKPTGEVGEKTRPALAKVECSDQIHLQGLAKLPIGTLLAPRDLGSALLLHTPHSVISAPYHRIGKAIIFNSEVHNDTPDRAHAKIKNANITYLVECSEYLSLATPEQKLESTLRMALLLDHPLSWLERIDVQSDVIKVWRVK